MSHKNNAFRNKNLDVLKLIASFFIVTIHIHFPEPFGSVIKSFSGFAVPIFFIVSGYYSYSAIEKKNYSKLLERIKRLVVIYFPSTVLFFIADYFTRNKSDRIIFVKEGLSIQALVKFFLFNKPLFNTPLWFLLALIYCYFLVIIFLKFDKIKLLSFLTLFLLLTNIFLIDVVFGLIKTNLSELFFRNFLVSGIPLFMLGYLIKKHETRINKISNIKIIIVLFIGVLFFIAEFIVFSANASISNKIIAVSVFVLVINNANNCLYTNREEILSLLPLFIYIIHLPMSTVFMYSLGNNTVIESGFKYFYPILIIVLSLMVSYCFSYLIVWFRGRALKNE